MSEPRMRARPKGAQFNPRDLEAMLMAFGDDSQPLPETVRVLDEMLTDYLIETSHLAAQAALITNRSKIKVDDFKFAMRKDPLKLGRITELLHTQAYQAGMKQLAEDITEGNVAGPGRGRGKRKGLDMLGDAVGEEEKGGKRKKAKTAKSAVGEEAAGSSEAE